MTYAQIATYLSNHLQWKEPSTLWVSISSFATEDVTQIRWDYNYSSDLPVRIDVPGYEEPIKEYSQKITDLGKILGIELIDLTKSENHEIGGWYSDENLCLEASVTKEGHLLAISLSDDWDNQWVIKGEGENWNKVLDNLKGHASNWKRIAQLTQDLLDRK